MREEWERQKEVFHLLIYSSNSRLARQKPGMGFFLVSHVGTGAQAPGLSSTAFPGALAGSWVRRREAGLDPISIRDAGATDSGFNC